MLDGITGLDRHALLKALTIALRAIDRVPESRRPRSDREAISRLLDTLRPSDTESDLYSGAADWILKDGTGFPPGESPATPSILAPPGRSQIRA